MSKAGEYMYLLVMVKWDQFACLFLTLEINLALI